MRMLEVKDSQEEIFVVDVAVGVGRKEGKV